MYEINERREYLTITLLNLDTFSLFNFEVSLIYIYIRTISCKKNFFNENIRKDDSYVHMIIYEYSVRWIISSSLIFNVQKTHDYPTCIDISSMIDKLYPKE